MGMPPVPEETFDMRRILRNSAFVYVRLAVLTVGNLLTVRLVLGALGVEGYGLVAAVGAAAAFLVFLNGVLNSTAQRFLSSEMRTGGQLAEAFSAVCWMTVALCGGIVLVGETAGLWFVRTRLSVPEGQLAAATVVYEVTVLQLVVQTARVPFSALVNATERMGFFAWTSVVELGLSVATALALFLLPSYRLEAYAALEALSSVLMLLVFARHGRRLCPGVVRLLRPALAHLRGQGAYFVWSSLHAVVNALKYNGVGLLVNLSSGVTANAAWRLGFVYGSHLGGIYHGFQQAYFPQMVKLWALPDRRPFRVLVLNASRWSFAATAVFAIPFLAFTEQVLAVLVGADLPPGTVSFVRCFVLHYLVDALVDPLHSAALAPGRIAGYEIGQAITIGSGFALAVAALALGLPSWTAVGAVATATALNLAYHLVYLRSLGFSWTELLLLRASPASTGRLRT